jgi:hypothetical protein
MKSKNVKKVKKVLRTAAKPVVETLRETVETLLDNPNDPIATELAALPSTTIVKPAPVAIGKGVYQSHNRSSAIVYKIAKGTVHFISMRKGVIDIEHMGIQLFAREFCYALPDYPVRRAARIYTGSFLMREPAADRVLRAILAS